MKSTLLRLLSGTSRSAPSPASSARRNRCVSKRTRWPDGTRPKFAHGWLGLSPRKANRILLPPGSLIDFLAASTVTKTELIRPKTWGSSKVTPEEHLLGCSGSFRHPSPCLKRHSAGLISPEIGPHRAAKRPGARARSGRPGQRSIRTWDWLREAERLLLHAVVKVNGRGSRHGYPISLQSLNSFRKVH